MCDVSSDSRELQVAKLHNSGPLFSTVSCLTNSGYLTNQKHNMSCLNDPRPGINHNILAARIQMRAKFGVSPIFMVNMGIKKETVTDTIVSITVSVMAYTTLFDTMQRMFEKRCNR